MRGESGGRRRVAALVVGLVALGTMGVTAVHATRVEAGLTTSADLRDARASNAYYACLTAEAHALLRTGDVVFLDHADLEGWTIVVKAVGGWATLTVDPRRSSVALLLETPRGGPTCDGQVLVSVRHGPGGTVVMRRAEARPR